NPAVGEQITGGEPLRPLRRRYRWCALLHDRMRASPRPKWSAPVVGLSAWLYDVRMAWGGHGAGLGWGRPGVGQGSHLPFAPEGLCRLPAPVDQSEEVEGGPESNPGVSTPFAEVSICTGYIVSLVNSEGRTR